MANEELPFQITVCGLEELASHAGKVSHVLSILDPGRPAPDVFGSYGEHARLELRFHDVIDDTPGLEPPQPGHVAEVLAFGRDILRDPKRERHLLVHCHAGISRSSASMTLLLAQAQPHLPAKEILSQVLAIREKAWPNVRILAFGEEQLGRTGDITAAVGAIYRRQIEREPGLAEQMRQWGRGREVDLALAASSSA
jgi:predicted protein tyrosine phosphatase